MHLIKNIYIEDPELTKIRQIEAHFNDMGLKLLLSNLYDNYMYFLYDRDTCNKILDIYVKLKLNFKKEKKKVKVCHFSFLEG